MGSPGSTWALVRDRHDAARRWARDRDVVVLAVVSVTVLALLLRFVALGSRVAHWDEARVAYWIVHYAETGSFAYRRIIHGPFVQHVNRWLFPVLGANDFTARLPVAVIGGLLPLSALLFRRHLRGVEVVALAGFLAVNPVLLYYSRFMRSDVLVAAFMFTALGLLVRLYDTRRVRYLYGVAAFAALGFTAKENAIVYVLTWVGAAALLADQALYRPRAYDSGFALLADRVRGLRARVEDDARSLVESILRYSGHVLGAVVLFAVITLFMYAPRGAGIEGIYHPPVQPSRGSVGLWQAVADPGQLPALVNATVDRTVEQFTEWFGYTSEPGCHEESVIDGYVCFLGRYVEVMLTAAIALTGFAVFGVVWERYVAERSRNLVLFAAYGGFVSILGYPLGTDVFGPWLVVHALVPLAIPAAVGVGRIYYWFEGAVDADDVVGAAITAALVFLVIGQVAAVGATAVYADHQADSNALVQYAQPGGDARSTLQEVRHIVRDNGADPDVLVYYGEQGDRYDDDVALVEKDRASWNQSGLDLRPTCTMWYNALPLPWYFAAHDADVACERDRERLATALDEDPPPVVITRAADETVPESRLATAYEPRTYEMRRYGQQTTFWIHEDWLDPE